MCKSFTMGLAFLNETKIGGNNGQEYPQFGDFCDRIIVN